MFGKKFKQSQREQIDQLEAQNKYLTDVLKMHHLDEELINRKEDHIALSDVYLIAYIQQSMNGEPFDEIYIGTQYWIDNRPYDDNEYFFSINLYWHEHNKKFTVHVPAIPKDKFFEGLSSNTYYKLDDLKVRYRYKDHTATEMISQAVWMMNNEQEFTKNLIP